MSRQHQVESIDIFIDLFTGKHLSLHLWVEDTADVVLMADILAAISGRLGIEGEAIPATGNPPPAYY